VLEALAAVLAERVEGDGYGTASEVMAYISDLDSFWSWIGGPAVDDLERGFREWLDKATSEKDGTP